MIRIFLGNVGSGKSISCVRDMKMNEDEIFFSNIITKSRGKDKLGNNHIIDRSDLIKKDLIKTLKNGEEVFKLKFNKEQWMQYREDYGKFNVVLDEFHTLMSSRDFSTRQNKVMGDFLALIRKICSDSTGDSTLTLISQLDNRIDVNARNMATEVRYHICLYDKVCEKCGAYWGEHSELPPFQKKKRCPNCESKKLKLINHQIMVHYFDSMSHYQDWKYGGINTKIQTHIINNIDEYFGMYNTYQITNLISED